MCAVCVSHHGGGACVRRGVQSAFGMGRMGLFRPHAQPLGTDLPVVLFSVDRRFVFGHPAVPTAAAAF